MYFENIAAKKKGPLCGGSYVTKLAKNLDVFRGFSGLNSNLKIVSLNIEVMQNMGMVRLQGNRYILAKQVEEDPAVKQQGDIPMGEPEQQPSTIEQ